MIKLVHYLLLIFSNEYNRNYFFTCYQFYGMQWARKCIEDGLSTDEIYSMLDLNHEFDRAAARYVDKYGETNA